MRLLVVDNDSDAARSLKSLLESLGYEVLALTSSRVAAERVDRQKFDGVFLDANMPDLDGFSLARLIRNSKSNSSVPIVMLAVHDDVDTMRAGFRAGITFFMGKPADLSGVASLLKPLHGAMLREKRSYVRLPLRTVVTCKTEKAHFTAGSLNIGEGGMLLDGPKELQEGQEVQLRFTLPGASVVLNPRAKVVRREPPGRLGVQFVEIGPEDRKAVREYIRGIVKE